MSGNSRTSTKYCCFPKEGWFTPVILQVSHHPVRDQHGLVVQDLIFMKLENMGVLEVKSGVSFVKRRSIQFRIYAGTNINSECTYYNTTLHTYTPFTIYIHICYF